MRERCRYAGAAPAISGLTCDQAFFFSGSAKVCQHESRRSEEWKKKLSGHEGLRSCSTGSEELFLNLVASPFHSIFYCIGSPGPDVSYANRLICAITVKLYVTVNRTVRNTVLFAVVRHSSKAASSLVSTALPVPTCSDTRDQWNRSINMYLFPINQWNYSINMYWVFPSCFPLDLIRDTVVTSGLYKWRRVR